MVVKFEQSEIVDDLEEFGLSIKAINMEKVKRRTLKRTAKAMAEMVRQAVIAEEKITSPAMNSIYSRGPGSSLATLQAWDTEEIAPDKWIVKPGKRQETRAVVLNRGHPGRIEPQNSEALKFTIRGVPVFAKSVDGPERTGYWQAAMQRMKKSDKLERIANDELDDEIREAMR